MSGSPSRLVDEAASAICHACAAESIPVFSESRQLAAVTSDCRAWPASFSVAMCPSCGLVQKVVDAVWRESVEQIYSSYDLYHQTPNRSEQVIFDQNSGIARPRSELMFEYYFNRQALAKNGAFLDLGCGTGPTLTAFAKYATGWRLFGYDPHLPDRQRVLTIPGVEQVYAGDLRDIAGKFDLLSAVHVLEHVVNPLEFLSGMRGLMHANSRALIQVPYFPSSPFDLAIFDHCSHFTRASVSTLLARAGLAIETIDVDLLPKEISIVVKPGEPAPDELIDAGAEVAAGIAWLERLQAQALSVETERLGVFGTSIGANWLHGLMPDRVTFFVDEDESRQGQHYRDCPVLSPAALPNDCRVLMPLPRATAEHICRRLGERANNYLLPPARADECGAEPQSAI